MKKLNLILFILAIASCKNNNDTNSLKDDVEPNTETQEKVTVNSKKFRLLTNSDFDIAFLNFEGQIVDKKIWEDKNGQNIAIFSEDESELFAYHYLVESNGVKLSSENKDVEKDCEMDLTLEFDRESISVTDLDKDNIGEIIFAYRKACISDVSPKQLNLIILEEKNEFFIKGQTAVTLGNDTLMKAKIDETNFSGAPNEFVNHATKIWKKISEN